jgi:hypothetical protein
VRPFRSRDAVGETPSAAVETTALAKKSLMIEQSINYKMPIGFGRI